MTIEHAQPIKHTCGACGHKFDSSIPYLICVRCHSPEVTRNHALMRWRAAELAKQAGCQVASELDVVSTHEAYRPGSPHWGSHPSPVAELVTRRAALAADVETARRMEQAEMAHYAAAMAELEAEHARALEEIRERISIYTDALARCTSEARADQG